MVSTLAFAFKIIRPIIFSAVKEVNYPQSRNFSTVKEIFFDQGNVPESRKSQGIFPQSRKLSTKNFT